MHHARSVGALNVFEKEFGDLGQDVEALALTEEPVKLSLGDVKLTVFPGYTTRENVEKKPSKSWKTIPMTTPFPCFPCTTSWTHSARKGSSRA